MRVAVLRPAVTVGSPEPLYEALGAIRAPRRRRRAPARAVPARRRPGRRRGAGLGASGCPACTTWRPTPESGEDAARALAGGVAKVTLPARLSHAVAAWTWQLWRSGVPVEARAYAIHPWVVAPDRLKAAGWAPQYSSEEALVATDMRVHWDDLPPGRRQNYNLLLAISGAVLLAGSAAAGVAAWRRRRRRSPSPVARVAVEQERGDAARLVAVGLVPDGTRWPARACPGAGTRSSPAGPVGPGDSSWVRLPLEVTGWLSKRVMMSLADEAELAGRAARRDLLDLGSAGQRRTGLATPVVMSEALVTPSHGWVTALPVEHLLGHVHRHVDRHGEGQGLIGTVDRVTG